MAIEIFGDREVVNRMMFGAVDPAFQAYVNQASQYFTNTISNVGRQFVDNAINTFTRMDSSEALSVARAAIRVVNTFTQENVIYQPTTIDQLQSAPDVMVRWIMTHPELRKLHHEGRIEAYGDRYVDNQPDGLYGWKHRDYAIIHSGWIEEYKKGDVCPITGEVFDEDYDMAIIELFDEDEYAADELLHEEADIIRSSVYRLVDKAIAEDRDPTSFYDSVIQ